MPGVAAYGVESAREIAYTVARHTGNGPLAMKKISLYINLFLSSLVLCAVVAAPVSAASLESSFATLVAQTGLALPKQAACIADKNGAVFSQNAEMRIIPASVSKLYAFDFALAKLPEDFRYMSRRFMWLDKHSTSMVAAIRTLSSDIYAPSSRKCMRRNASC